jgi:dipeptidyl aminopeptidase/acylaminoacyl peptidase
MRLQYREQDFPDGLKQLKSLPYIDKQNIFIAGFSIGGVITRDIK